MAKRGKYKIQNYIGNQVLDLYVDEKPEIGETMHIKHEGLIFSLLIRTKTHELCYIAKLLQVSP